MIENPKLTDNLWSIRKVSVSKEEQCTANNTFAFDQKKEVRQDGEMNMTSFSHKKNLSY